MIDWIQTMIPTFHASSLEAAAILILLLSILHYRREILKLLRSKHTWGFAAMLFCLAMVSGHMWNKIRSPRFSLKTKDGPVFISSGQKIQFKVESYIVAILNAAVVFGMILTIEGAGGVKRIAASRIQCERRKRKTLQLTGLFMMLSSFLVLLSLFRVKRPWYPYGFLMQ